MNEFYDRDYHNDVDEMDMHSWDALIYGGSPDTEGFVTCIFSSSYIGHTYGVGYYNPKTKESIVPTSNNVLGRTSMIRFINDTFDAGYTL
jgi:hypothetical protein